MTVEFFEQQLAHSHREQLAVHEGNGAGNGAVELGLWVENYI